VGFAVITSPESPVGINERLITWQIPLTKKCYGTLILAYAPTLDVDPESKEAFHASLNAGSNLQDCWHKTRLRSELEARIDKMAVFLKWTYK
jgi:hypothetical protein